MCQFEIEQARTQTLTADNVIRREFGQTEPYLDAVFMAGDRRTAMGVCGLPFPAPVCSHLLNDRLLYPFFRGIEGSFLISLRDGQIYIRKSGENSTPELLSEEKAGRVRAVIDKVLRSPGQLNEAGELVLDLKTYPVGTHYPVNLLLGNRAGYPNPLLTTPKSVLDALGRGSFRGTCEKPVLATRYVLQPEENGEPSNRQFYLLENGRQIFYSANVNENTADAQCVHSQNRTIITYKTECGLDIKRTIFLLPQEEGMPNAVEVQRVEITNHSGKERDLSIVMTGMFGITDPSTLANDIVYANIVVESEVFYKNGKPAALTLHHNPAECAGEKRFALLLCGGETLDSFCTSLPDFIGTGDLAHPELVAFLPNAYSRKMTPFFAAGKQFRIAPEKTAVIDEFVGMMESEGDVTEPFAKALGRLIDKYSDPENLTKTFESIVDFWNKYPRYLVPQSGDAKFDSYVSHNLPFQVLYQTYVSRSFAWTQKSFRETGFREIQDIFASMYYLSALGENAFIKELISPWICNVFRMGYAYHDFTFRGKDPGGCSDDALWLVQAVYRYVELTGDSDFLLQDFPIAGEPGEKRSLWDTLNAILTYSGRISVGAHGMPLLDRADWNDTLRLDKDVLNGPEKEKQYRQQLEEAGEEWGAQWHNNQTESVMNACLLIIAADAVKELSALIGREEDGIAAGKIAEHVRQSVRENAWKGDFFARCLINDGRGYEYLGAGKDGLSLVPEIDGTYFLNSYSWSILSQCASEDQISASLETVEKYLKTDAGLKLCTLVDFDKLKIRTGTQLYFPGDRENGGVFKHAAMMAAVASLKASKTVKDLQLADRLRNLAFFMIDRTVPYAALADPFTLKGNPRFCTQYNNSETGENIGPMLSGTASWLTLAVYEILGVDIKPGKIRFSPVLRENSKQLAYTINLKDASINVSVISEDGTFRTGAQTEYSFDGKECSPEIDLPSDNQVHELRIRLKN